jgi:hypothetical protein
MPVFVNKGEDVFLDPTVASDGPVVLNAALIIPPRQGEHINGAPVDDLSHQFVIKKTNAPDQ